MYDIDNIGLISRQNLCDVSFDSKLNQEILSENLAFYTKEIYLIKFSNKM